MCHLAWKESLLESPVTFLLLLFALLNSIRYAMIPGQVLDTEMESGSKLIVLKSESCLLFFLSAALRPIRAVNVWLICSRSLGQGVLYNSRAG